MLNLKVLGVQRAGLGWLFIFTKVCYNGENCIDWKNCVMKKLSIALVSFLVSIPAWAYSLTIVSPTQDQAILYPGIDKLSVQVKVNEPVIALDTLYILLDNELVEVNQTELEVQVAELGFGRHTLTAQIKNEMGQVVAKDSRHFNVIINPAIPKKVRAEQEAAQRQADYDALPWYKKAKLKITQNDIVISSNGVAKKTTDDTKKTTAVSSPNAVQSLQGITPLSSGNKTSGGNKTTTGIATTK